VIIYDQADQVVLLRRNRDPGKGMLGLPGGFVDLGETAEQAATREVQEEIGVAVNDFQFVCTFPNQYVYQDVVVPVLDIFFCVRVDELGQLTIDEDEVGGAEKLPLNDETLSQLAFKSNRQALEVMRANLEKSAS
jgi:ADP-ribose pyrophosphatase